MGNPFNKVRSVTDKQLGMILYHHQQASQYAVSRVVAYDQYRWLRRAWYVAVTAAIARAGDVEVAFAGFFGGLAAFAYVYNWVQVRRTSGITHVRG